MEIMQEILRTNEANIFLCVMEINCANCLK